MKFTCDKCDAQYMIADEKLGERGVKVKCKKCTNVIIVRPPAAGEGDERRDTDAMGGAFQSMFGDEKSDAGAAAGGPDPLGGQTVAMNRAQLDQLRDEAAQEQAPTLEQPQPSVAPDPLGNEQTMAMTQDQLQQLRDEVREGAVVDAASVSYEEAAGVDSAPSEAESSFSFQDQQTMVDEPMVQVGAVSPPADLTDFAVQSSPALEIPADAITEGPEPTGEHEAPAEDAGEDIEWDDEAGPDDPTIAVSVDDDFLAAAQQAATDDAAADTEIFDGSAAETGEQPEMESEDEDQDYDDSGPIESGHDADEEDSAADFGSGEEVEAPAPQLRSRAGEGKKEWYVAIDDEQVGPLGFQEIEHHWDNGQLNAESMAWRPGMEDWEPIVELDDLDYLVTDRPQAAAQELATGPAAEAAAQIDAASFSGDGSGDDVDWTPSAASALSALAEEEIASAEQAQHDNRPGLAPAGLDLPDFGADDLFGGDGDGAAQTDDEAPQQVATVPETPEDQVAAIAAVADIEAPQKVFEPLDDGGTAAWAVPAKPKRRIENIHLIMATGGFLGLCMIGLIVALLLRPSQAVVPPPLPTPSQPAPAPTPVPVTPPTAKADETPAEAQPAENDVAKPKAAASSAKKAKKPKSTSTKRASKAQTPKKKKKGIDDIFDDAPASKTVKKQLTRQDILSAVKKYKGTLATCLKTARSKSEIAADRYTFILEWEIKTNGGVASPRLLGPAHVLKTSLSSCFAAKMKKWKFPPSAQKTPITNFPFGPIRLE